jgi:hypothetical protein
MMAAVERSNLAVAASQNLKSVAAVPGAGRADPLSQAMVWVPVPGKSSTTAGREISR